MARDKQKSKVYKWERNFYKSDRMFRKNCIIKQHKRLNKKFFRSYGRGVTLEITNGYYRCHAVGSTRTITLRNQFGLNYAILLHEWAHILAYEYYDRNHSLEAHGPEFVSIYMNLLNTYLGIDMKEMTRKRTAVRRRLGARACALSEIRAWRTACRKNKFWSADCR